MKKIKNKKIKALFLLGFVAVITVGLAMNVGAVSENDTESSDVNVTIASTVAVDLHPEQLTYPQATVGSQVTSTDRSFTSVDIENVGSEYIDQIWVETTQPGSEPFGTGLPGNYDAGNFFQIKPNNASGKLKGDSDAYHFVNRIEYATYNDSLVPSYINAPSSGTYESTTGSASANDVAVGRFRVGDEEYFFAIPVSGGSGSCDGTGGHNTLLVAKQPHTETSTTPIDFTDGTGYPGIEGKDYIKYNITELTDTGEGFGLTDSGPADYGANGVTIRRNFGTAQEVNRTYDALVKCDTNGESGLQLTDVPRVIRTRYNVEEGGASDLTDDSNGPMTFLMSTITPSEMLLPGEAVTLDTAIEVPRGVSQGQMTEGTFTVYVTADTSASVS